MSNRSNLGRSNARNSARARRRGGLADLVDWLGLTIDDLYPVFDLLLPGGAIVQQRGSDAGDAARRYWLATGVKAEGVRKHKA